MLSSWLHGARSPQHSPDRWRLIRNAGIRRLLFRLVLGSAFILGSACTGKFGGGAEADEEHEVLARNCVQVVDERGAIVRLGPDCRINPPSLPPATDTASGADPGGSDEQDEPRQGCPLAFFEKPTERGSVRFAFPIRDEHTILLEPGVIHVDHSAVPASEGLECTPFASGHVCYARHRGTDFMLGLMWSAMEDGVTVRAAAAGVVTEVVDGNFDGCHADLNPLSPSFGGITCPDPEAGSNEVTGANLVRVCHSDGAVSTYAHLMNESVAVQVGDRVACGDRLGLAGSSGISAAPHLHFEVTALDGDGERRVVDPYSTDPEASLWVDQQGAAWGTLPTTDCQS